MRANSSSSQRSLIHSVRPQQAVLRSRVVAPAIARAVNSRRVWTLAVFISGLLGIRLSGSPATPCESCGGPASVAIYDFDARSLKPDVPPDNTPDAQALVDNYLTLYNAAGGFDEALAQQPMSGCLDVRSFEVHPGEHHGGGLYDVQPTFPWRPPAEKQFAAYFISGAISGHLGDYKLEVQLADSNSGTVISTVETHFSAPGESRDAGQRACRLMSPLITPILAHERNLRDTSRDPTALHALFEVQPDKHTLHILESTTVHFKLLDCDGTPLAHRRFAAMVHSGPGTITPLSLVTDDHGLATARFTATDAMGVASVWAVYTYTNIRDVLENAECSPTFITVGATPIHGKGSDNQETAIWELNAHVTQRIETQAHQDAFTVQPNHQFTRSLHDVRGRDIVDFYINALFKGPPSMMSQIGRNYGPRQAFAVAGIGSDVKSSDDLNWMKDPGYLHTILTHSVESGWLRDQKPVGCTVSIRDGKLAVAIEADFATKIHAAYSEWWRETQTPIEPTLSNSENEGETTFSFDSRVTQIFQTTSEEDLEHYSIPIHLETRGSLGDGVDAAKETTIIKIDGSLSILRDPGE